MPFVLIACYFIGTKIGAFFYTMFAHPIMFLIGLVRFALVLAALIVGFGGPTIFPHGGWLWIVGCVLGALFLLFIQRKLRDFAEGL